MPPLRKLIEAQERVLWNARLLIVLDILHLERSRTSALKAWSELVEIIEPDMREQTWLTAALAEQERLLKAKQKRRLSR